MPFDKLGHAAAQHPASWPGTTPVKTQHRPKFGSVQQAPRSAPQRALDAIRQRLQKIPFLRHQPVQVAAAPLPRQKAPVAVVDALLGPAIGRMADAHAAVDQADFNAAALELGVRVDDLLGRMRRGEITGALGKAAIDALARGDTRGFALALKHQVLEGLPPGQPGRFGDWLDAALLTAVENSIRDQGPLTSAPVERPAAPRPLLGADREPLVRLQALSATEQEMAPMLDTLSRVADAMAIGDGPRIEAHLSRLAAEMRPLLERQDKAVKVAFAQSDGQAFIQDLKQAILARASDDERHQVALQLEHFMGPYLEGAFHELVDGMLQANPEVQRASFRLPVDANVGVVALRQVAQALQALHAAEAKGAEADVKGASGDLRRAIGHFLGLARSGAVAPEVVQTFQQAMDGDDVQAFIDVMSGALLASVPPDQHEPLQALLEREFAPLVREDAERHGTLKLHAAPAPQLRPKTRFDAPLLPAAHLGALQGPPAQTQRALQAMAQVAQAMASDRPEAVAHKLQLLVKELRPLLQAQSESVRLAFTLSDGGAFIDDLTQAILEQTPPNLREHVAAQLGLFMRPALQQAFDRLVSGVLDQATLNPHLPHDPPKTMTVGGRTYTRVEDDKGIPKRVGEGSFGVLYKYENLAVKGRRDERGRPLKDEVVLKMPLKGDADPGSPLARQRLLTDPVREGHASVLVMGTGGGTAHSAQLVGAVRTEDRMMLVYRFEQGGSLKQKVDALNAGPTDAKVARGKLGLLLDIVAALRRLHEVKGLVHRDIALRNVLLDDAWRAVLNDFGMSLAFDEDSALDGAEVQPDAGPLPLRWTAPEVKQKQPVTQKSEVFSLGVTFIELIWGMGEGVRPWSLEGNDVFKASGPPWDAKAMVAKLGEIPAHLWPGVDRAELAALVTRMIDADPSKRPTLAEVAASPVLQGVLPEHRAALKAMLDGGPAKADASGAVPGLHPAPAPVALAPIAPAPVAPAPVAPAPPPREEPGAGMEYHQA